MFCRFAIFHESVEWRKFSKSFSVFVLVLKLQLRKFTLNQAGKSPSANSTHSFYSSRNKCIDDFVFSVSQLRLSNSEGRKGAIG